DLKDRVVSRLLGIPTDQRTVAAVRQQLFEALGRGGLNWLKPVGHTGDATVNDILVSPDPAQITTATDTVTFDLQLGHALALYQDPQNPLHVDIGLPALGLSVEGSPTVQLGFDFGLKFAISKSQGFFLDTAGFARDPATGNALAVVGGRPAELAIRVDARLNGLNATGKLGFLQLQVADSAQRPSHVTATFGVDLRDLNADNRLTLGELTSVSDLAQ